VPPRIRNLVAMALVADVPRSIAFYERLGFRVDNTFVPPEAGVPSWVWLDAGRSALMLARATEPVDREPQRVLFYLYYDDVPAAKAAFLEAGIEGGPMTYPFYAPRGEFRIVDPDGHVLMVTHA
jgi:catechol 2,3-dioxygenase-like lactoylglutathione lyase family enzyme